MITNKKDIKLLSGIWVVSVIWILFSAGMWFGGLAAAFPLIFMKPLVAISILCFLGSYVCFCMSPIYFAFQFNHRHLVGIAISTFLSSFFPLILIPCIIFWAYLPLERKS